MLCACGSSRTILSETLQSEPARPGRSRSSFFPRTQTRLCYLAWLTSSSHLLGAERPTQCPLSASTWPRTGRQSAAHGERVSSRARRLPAAAKKAELRGWEMSAETTKKQIDILKTNGMFGRCRGKASKQARSNYVLEGL